MPLFPQFLQTLWMAAGSVLNFNNGNVTATHATGRVAWQNTTGGTSTTAPLRSVNVVNNALVEGFRVEGARSAPAANDSVYLGTWLSNLNNVPVLVSRISTTATSVTAGAENGRIDFSVIVSGTMTQKMVMSSSTLRPDSDAALSLGNTSQSWNGAFLSTGTAINWANSNVTITHSSGALAITGVTTVASATATPAGGSTGARLLFGTTSGFGIYYGSGAPTVSAAQGSIYLRSDGSSTSTRMYVNNSSGSGTTWTAVTTEA